MCRRMMFQFSHGYVYSCTKVGLQLFHSADEMVVNELLQRCKGGALDRFPGRER